MFCRVPTCQVSRSDRADCDPHVWGNHSDHDDMAPTGQQWSDRALRGQTLQSASASVMDSFKWPSLVFKMSFWPVGRVTFYGTVSTSTPAAPVFVFRRLASQTGFM